MKSRSPFLVGLLLALSLGAQVALAVPSVNDVQAATRAGDYPRAEQMMREVVEAKPGSAKAHYVLAEILAHQRKFIDAAEQARLVRLNDPELKSVDRAKFTEFERLLERAQGGAVAATPAQLPAPAPAPVTARAPAPASSSGGGVPLWMLLGGTVLFIGLAARWMRRRAAAPTAMPAPGYGGATAMPMGGYGPGSAPSQGPGLMGVGLAAAGGVAAGMLAERLLHGGSDRPASHGDGYAPGGAFDGGGSYDAGAAQDLASRDIDFGSGDSWDAGGGGGDFGGGSDGGGGGDW